MSFLPCAISRIFKRFLILILLGQVFQYMQSLDWANDQASIQCSHQDFSLGSPRAPSAEKQGPCKNIWGTKVIQMVSYMKYLPDPISRTRHLPFDNDAYTNLHHVRGNNKISGNKIKSQSFDNMFSFQQTKCWGARLTIKTTPKSLL